MKETLKLRLKALAMGVLAFLVFSAAVWLLPGKYRFNIAENRSNNVIVQLIPDGTSLYLVISGPANKEVALRTGWESISGTMTRADGSEVESPYADKMAGSDSTSWTTVGQDKMAVLKCELAKKYSTGTGTCRFQISLLPPDPAPDAIKLFGAKSIWNGPPAHSNTITVTSVAGAQTYR
jgi:hypothetical protein